MNLKKVKHNLTIQEIASVHAQKKSNELTIQHGNLLAEKNKFLSEFNPKISEKINAIFENSKYFQSYQLLFSQIEPCILFTLEMPKSSNSFVKNEYKESFNLLPIHYLIDRLYESKYTLILRLKNGSDDVNLELEGKLDTLNMGIPEALKVQEKLSEVQKEMNKDWEKIYTTHFLAQKMVEKGLNEPFEIQDLPSIQLNHLLT